MTDRIQKRPSRDQSRKSALAEFIRTNGFEVMPCTRCYKAQRVCKMLPSSHGRSSRCDGCARDQKSCDGNMVASRCRFSVSCIFPFSSANSSVLVVTRTLNEQKRVQEKRERAELDAAALSAQLAETSARFSEALGRLDRLRKQESSLRDRGFAMFERGMQEEDAAIARESSDTAAVERQQCVGDLQSLGAFGVVDWDALGFDLSVPVVADPGSSDETGQAAPGSS